jgi:hypothetical protein
MGQLGESSPPTSGATNQRGGFSRETAHPAPDSAVFVDFVGISLAILTRGRFSVEKCNDLP